MGIIQRQTIKNNLVAFLGVGIGAVSQLFIYPQNVDLKGHFDGIISAAQLIVPFLLLGMPAVMVRYLPYVKGESETRRAGQLLLRSLLVASTALALLVLANWLFGNRLGVGQGALRDSRWAIIGVAAGLTYAGIFTAHLVNFRRIAVPVIFNNLLLKIGAPLIVLATVYGYLQDEQTDGWLVALYVAPVLGLLIYAYALGSLRPSYGRLRLEGTSLREIFQLAVFSILGTVGARLALQLDTLSINTILGETDTGLYALPKFIINVMLVPAAAVNAITAPLIASAWRERNFSHLGALYRDTAQVLYAIGGLIFVGAVVCLPYLYGLTPKLEDYRVGYGATLLLGAAQLFDLMTSINGNLIGMTDYFRWNVFFILSLGLLNVFLNYFFLAVLGYGIEGAALSTLVSVLLYNCLKVVFVYRKMRLQPFSPSLLYTTGALVVCGLIAWFLPLQMSRLPNILLRGLALVSLFFLYLRFTQGVPPLRRFLSGGVGQLFR